MDRICKGNLNAEEIICAHQVYSGKELSDIKVGQKVILSIRKSKHPLMMFGVEKETELSKCMDVYYQAIWATEKEIESCR